MQRYRPGPVAFLLFEEIEIVGPQTGHGGSSRLVPIEGNLRPGLFQGQQTCFQGTRDQGEPQFILQLRGPGIVSQGAVQGPVVVVGVPDILSLKRSGDKRELDGYCHTQTVDVGELARDQLGVDHRGVNSPDHGDSLATPPPSFRW